MFAYCVLGLFVFILYGFYNVITIDERKEIEKSKAISKNKANEIADMLEAIYEIVNNNNVNNFNKANLKEELITIKNKISNIETKLTHVCDYIEETKNNNNKKL